MSTIFYPRMPVAIDTSIPPNRPILELYDEKLKSYVGDKGKPLANIDYLGGVGERIVIWYLTQLGYKITENINPFDSQKDIIVQETPTVLAPKRFVDKQQWNAEIKTQTPFISQQAFTIRENQLTKCANVDALFIVTPPFVAPRNCRSFAPGIWLSTQYRETRLYHTKQGLPMVLMPRKNFKFIYEITIREQIEMLLRYSNNDYRYTVDYESLSTLPETEHVLNRRYDGYINSAHVLPEDF